MSLSHPARAVAALAAAVLVLLLSPPGPSAAHTSLRSTTPADGARLDAPPREVVLLFTDELVDLGTQIVVAGPDGPIQTGPPEVSGESVALRLPDGVPAGDYAVAWRVTASDGHPITGTFGFAVAGVAEGDETATAGPSPSEPPPSEPPPSEVAPSPTAAPSPTPASTPAAAPIAGTSPLTALAVGAAVAGAAAALLLLLRRRG